MGVLVLLQLECLRSCFRWLVLMIATHLLVEPLPQLEILPWLPTLLLQEPTLTWLLTCGRRPSLPRHLTKNLQIIWPRIILLEANQTQVQLPRCLQFSDKQVGKVLLRFYQFYRSSSLRVNRVLGAPCIISERKQ